MTNSTKFKLLFLFFAFLFLTSHVYSQINADSLKTNSQDNFAKVAKKTSSLTNKIEKGDISSIFKTSYLKKVSSRTAAFNKRLESANAKYLKKYLSADNALQKKLSKVNPALANHLFSPAVDPLYNHQNDVTNPAWLKNKPAPKENNPSMDTLKASLNTLSTATPKDSAAHGNTVDSLNHTEKTNLNKDAATSEKQISQGLIKDSAMLKQNLQNEKSQLIKSETKNLQPAALINANSQTNKLEQNLNYSGKLQQYFRQRKIRMADVATKYPDFQKNYLSMDKINYYYRQQINECKKIFAQEKSKVEQQATNLIKSNKVFKQCMQKNGQLSAAANKASSTSQNNSGKNSASADSLTAPKKLTVDEVNQMMQHDIKALGEPSASVLAEKMKPMTDALNKLKSGNYGNTTSAEDLPAFKPNPLKTKPLLKRLEYGIEIKPISGAAATTPITSNMSSATNYAPSFASVKGASLAFTLGYKLTKITTLGIGASHDEGIWATWKKIRGANLGTGLRSFTDCKIKKAIYIEGAYERNLIALVSTNSSVPVELTNQTQSSMQWVSSALLGVKFKPGAAASPTMTLLYDFLHDQHVPASPALIYRLGWSFGSNLK